MSRLPVLLHIEDRPGLRTNICSIWSSATLALWCTPRQADHLRWVGRDGSERLSARDTRGEDLDAVIVDLLCAPTL